MTRLRRVERSRSLRKMNAKCSTCYVLMAIVRPEEREICVYSEVHAVNAGSLIKHENDARIIN